MSALAADVYQWRDAEGHVHFADSAAEPSAQKLDIQPNEAFVTVKKVFDGDTVELQDGRKVRFLGINTPEVAHRGKPTEPGGEEAKQWLQKRLANARVHLVGGVEPTDHYGRTLAHLFTDDHSHINRELVAQGLAAVNIYPPNLGYVPELVAAEREAEAKKLGIWGRPDYAPLTTAELDDNVYQRHRWLRVKGRVQNVHSTGQSVYLDFADGFAVRIAKEHLPLFGNVQDYQGQTLEARGWLGKNKDRWVMTVMHPSALR